MEKLITNPISIWLKRLITNRKYLNSTHKVEYNAILKDVVLEDYVSIGRESSCISCTVGFQSYIAENCRINRSTIGRYCSIASDVKIGLGKHPVSDYFSTHPCFYSIHNQTKLKYTVDDSFAEFEEVEIGNDVWIGSNVIVLDGVHISDGAIIAAGAVVTKDVAPYSVVGGIPAKHIKFRFRQETIEKLLGIKWWYKDNLWIKDNLQYLKSVINDG